MNYKVLLLANLILLSSCTNEVDDNNEYIIDEEAVVKQTADAYARERIQEEKKLLTEALEKAKEKDKCIIDAYFTYQNENRIINYVKQPNCDNLSQGVGNNTGSLLVAAVAGGVIGGTLASLANSSNNLNFNSSISEKEKEEKKRNGFVSFYNSSYSRGVSLGKTRAFTLKQNAIKSQASSARSMAKSASSSSRSSFGG